MQRSTRFSSITLAAVLTASLAACGSQPVSQVGQTYPAGTYPAGTVYPAGQYPSQYPQQPYPQQGTVAPNYVEYGRVTGVQVIQTQQPGRTSGAGAVIGGIGGAVIGNQIGGGSGRDVARIAGVVGGAIAGNAIEKNLNNRVAETYRISVQTDNGVLRAYDLTSNTDLRAGDRVRIENGQLFRM